MPRKRKFANRLVGNTAGEVMEEAVKKVVNQNYSLNQTHKMYDIPISTLRRYVQKYKNAAPENQQGERFKFIPNYSVNKVFSIELETELKNYLILASKIHHGLTRTECKRLAYELAVKNELKVPPSWETKKCAGEDWLKGFRERWKEISIRKPEATSLARATSFNRTTVKEFFDNLSSVYADFADTLGPELVFNLDETALTTVHRPPNVLCQKGVKQVGQVTSGERGTLVTVCCIINAAGNKVPPYMIFPRVNFKPHMLNGAPPGTAGSASKSGWINGPIFVDVLRHFTKHVRCSKEQPVILLMDNHETHIQLEAIDFAKANGIVLVTFPPHTSAKLQPLDRTVYKSLKNYYNVVCNDWMLSNPGRTITIYDVAGLFGKAYIKSVESDNIVSGFSCTGIYPLQREIFKDEDFLCSYVTDRPEPVLLDVSNHEVRETTPQPSTSGTSIRQSNSSSETPKSIHSTELKLVTPSMIRPLKKAQERKVNFSRKRKRSEILTSTPTKSRLEEEHRMKLEKRMGKCKKKIIDIEKDSDSETTEDDSLSLHDDSDEDQSFDLETDTDEFPLIENINEEQFVLICEGEGRNKTKVYSIGQVTSVYLNDITVTYFKRLSPYLKFAKTEESYVFNKNSVIRILPKPVPVGGTKRRAEVLVFEVDLYNFRNSLK